MNEIEKMYENAGVSCKPNYVYNKVPILSGIEYPLFTAKKQIELIKWLIASGECYFAVTIKPDEFEEYLAKYINNMWKDLADIDKKQIKDILK